jgi:hypothetical protein
MNDSVGLKTLWDQSKNYTRNLKNLYLKYLGLDLKILAYLVLLIYWPVILLAPFLQLKVTKANKVRFSPHQIAFHVKHPHNTFIIVDPLGPRSLKHVHMYRGSRILDLVEQGLKLDACSLGLDACRLMLNQVGSKAS